MVPETSRLFSMFSEGKGGVTPLCVFFKENFQLGNYSMMIIFYSE